MSKLTCAHCAQDISATHKTCPHCSMKISFWGAVKASIEHNRLYQALFALALVFIVGCGWYIRAHTGMRWTLFAVVIVCAPFVPWLLKIAYKNAAPDDTSRKN